MTAEWTNVSWPDLAIGLFEKLNEKNAEISYDFENMEVGVPSGTGENAERAIWVANGTLKISTTTVK